MNTGLGGEQMYSWTTCFVAALVTAAAGALCLSLIAPSRPHDEAVVARSAGEDARETRGQIAQRDVARGAVAPTEAARVQRFSASRD